MVAPFARGVTGWLLAVASVAAAAACAGNPPPARPPASLADSPPVVGLLPGDAIRVSIWREADLSGEFTVGTEGVVVLPLLGERRVSGVEPGELERRLRDEYGEFLENPSIEVTALRRIAILGEVELPGLYPVDATVTLADALALAGGVTPEGDPGDVRLVRDGQVTRLDIDRGMLAEPLVLHSGDRILVGRRSWLDRNRPLFGLGVGAVGAAIAAIIVAGS